MIKISLLDLLLRAVPESFLFVLAAYLFSERKFNKNRMILSTVIFSIATYFIRLMPIQLGINVILSILVYIGLSIKINYIPLVKSVRYSLILMAMLSVSEQLNLIMLNYIFHNNTKFIFSNELLKNLYFIPSILLFMLGILICHKLFQKFKIKTLN